MKIIHHLLVLSALCAPIAAPAVLGADPIADMRQAAEQLAQKDWTAAAESAPEGVGLDYVHWSKLRAGEGSLAEYEDFLARRADWPGLALVRRQGEAMVAQSDTPARVAAYFASHPPQTGAGVVALVRAYLALNQPGNAEMEIMRAWSELALDSRTEGELRALLPEATQLNDEARLDAMLWEGRRDEARRVFDYVPEAQRKLAEARIGLRAQVPGVNALIEAVPAAQQKDPGLAYERFVWRMKNDMFDEATELLLAQPSDNLGRPELWAPRRSLLAHWLVRKGRMTEAYRVASEHGLAQGARYADLEFWAGFIALRHLNKPETALSHFARLRAGVSTAISVSRADYWQGRAEEAAGRTTQARTHYQNAAQHQTAYYGLLAGERLGLTLDPALLNDQPRGDWRAASFTKSSVLTMGRLLIAIDDLTEAKRFLLHLAESQPPEQIEQMADMALELKQPNLALLLAKQAAEKGHIVSRSYFPLTDMVPDGLAAPRELALAIARRESEFYPRARSGADARGLMQVLPETAQRMARKIGLEYSEEKLYDPAFNVQVGAAYLANMAEQFGPSVALIAAGYNAGPGRPKRWIDEYGDPRAASVDVVDWVETIPFGETRTYVMRVVEGVEIYRAKLSGTAGPIAITSALKGR